MKKLVLMFIASLVSLGVCANDFDELENLLGTEADVKITLGEGMLSLANIFVDHKTDVKPVLSGLHNLTVKVYHLDDVVDAEKINHWMTSRVKKLAHSGVKEMVKLSEDDERVHILAKVNGNHLSDVSIMVYEAGDEFVYINLDGVIDMKNLKQVTSNFDVDIDDLRFVGLN